MPVPTAERHPAGLDSYWTHVWEHALKVMKKQESWAWELKPLLDEYVFALRAAKDSMEAGEDTRWDRHSKRAAVLADLLVLTPASRRRYGIGAEDAAEDPFAAFAGDEVAEARRRRAS